MDKVQRRALGFAIWVILALIVTLLLNSYVPRLRGLGAALCLPLMVPCAGVVVRADGASWFRFCFLPSERGGFRVGRISRGRRSGWALLFDYWSGRGKTAIDRA